MVRKACWGRAEGDLGVPGGWWGEGGERREGGRRPFIIEF
jgi:hypothetical protein